LLQTKSKILTASSKSDFK